MSTPESQTAVTATQAAGPEIAAISKPERPTYPQQQGNALVYKPVGPGNPVPAPKGPSIFLAGSIEMGAASPWQEALTTSLQHLPVTVLNPRRPDWDSTWQQRKTHPEFDYQVKWELDCLERADVIAMYLEPGTMSPISLLELGLFARSGKLIVCCPEGFHRLGNVEITCEFYKVPLIATSLDSFMKKIVEEMTKRCAPKLA